MIHKREGEADGMSDERGAAMAIDFITFCFKRRAVEWPLLYDEMCHVAGNRLYKGLGYDELNDAGLDFTLSGLGKTSRLANEVTKQLRREPSAVGIPGSLKPEPVAT